MARAPDGLTQQQAALLLRSQQRRDAALRAEQGRCAAAADQARIEVQAADALAIGHAEKAADQRRRAYAGLIGHAVDAWTLLSVRQAEEAAAEHQAGLRHAAAAACDRRDQAARDEAAARQQRLVAARQLARREHLHQAIATATMRRQADLDERRADDADLALRARRP